jgi:hypothetical protein
LLILLILLVLKKTQSEIESVVHGTEIDVKNGSLWGLLNPSATLGMLAEAIQFLSFLRWLPKGRQTRIDLHLGNTVHYVELPGPDPTCVPRRELFASFLSYVTTRS